MQSLISVIVPMYNAESHIEKCIKSIQAQTYENIEIVVVDDGSKDDSLSVCERIAQRDLRIRIVKKSNGGVVSARKAGAEAATGDFVSWVDADDWIECDYLEKLFKLREETEADVVAVAHYHDIGEKSSLVKNAIPTGVYATDEIVGTMLYAKSFFEYGIGPHLYTKLFRSSIVKDAQRMVPNHIVAGDDAAVVYPSLLKAKRICVSDMAGYHYVQTPGSITKVRGADEAERIQVLIDYLHEVFEQEGVFKLMKNQLCIYRNYLLALRDIRVFDAEDTDRFLIPFGGIKKDSRVVIYGAGVLGQQIREYLVQNGILVVDWMDRSFEFYQKEGFCVHSPEVFPYEQDIYDTVIVANITQKIAISIKEYLVSKGVPEEKILWFTGEFRGVDE